MRSRRAGVHEALIEARDRVVRLNRERQANSLMHELCCPISKQPELKAAAVIVAPVESLLKTVQPQPD